MKPIIDDSIEDYNDFIDFAGQFLEIIDDIYTDRSIPIDQRPFSAVYELIKSDHFEVHNATKEELLEPPWFYYWYIRVKKWYVDKYGKEALILTKKDNFKSYILIKNIPYAFLVPTTIKRKGESADLFVLKFPNKVLTDENPFDWVVSAPIKNALSSEDFEMLMQDASKRANRIRNIHSFIRIVPSKNEEMNTLLQHIPAHLEWFVDEYLLNRKSSIGIWELNFAVESALKFNYFTNSGQKADYVHDLQKLYNNCLKALKIDSKLLKYLPLTPIAYRYGEKVINDSHVISNIYDEVLEIIEWALSTSKTDYSVSGDGIEMVIRNPYYH